MGMRPKPEIANGRLERIESIVADLAERIGRCESVDFPAIRSEHADLLPELDERLHLLQGIQQASQAVLGQHVAHRVDGRSDDIAALESELQGYHILEQLRSGGQGVVYRAVQRSTERTVAIKVLLDGLLVSPRQQRRFVREVRIASRLRHPNIVAIYEAGIVGRRPYYVMEYVDGVALDDYILLHGLDARQTVALVVKVCHAVHAAHQRGIVHRDLKPSNILVDDQGEPKVVDFGLAKLVTGDGDTDEDLSVAGRVVGTLPYLSPEQATASETQVDVRTDVYAIGVVLYQALTDRFPYPVDGPPYHVLANIAAREPTSLREQLRGKGACELSTSRGVNDDLDKVLGKALSKKPADRYQSMESLASDLERYLHGEAVVAKANNRIYQLVKVARRYRVPLAFASLLVIVVFLAQWAVFRAEEGRREDARLAAMGLDLGGLVRLGANYQNEGQADRALVLFQTALQLSAKEPEDDVSAVFRFDALYRSAATHYEHGRPDEARPYAIEAAALAQQLRERAPENPQWLRFCGMAAGLRASEAVAAKQWAQCERHYDEAIGILRTLRETEPATGSLGLELATAYCNRAKCVRQKGDLAGALADSTLAREILAPLYEASPENLAYAIELARIEGSLAVAHLSFRTSQGNAEASTWLDSAESRLRAVQTRPESEGRAWTISRVLQAIQTNRDLVDRRLRSSAEGS